MKGTGRQSVLKPPRKLDTITHGCRTTQISRTMFGELVRFHRSASGRYHSGSVTAQGQPLGVALVVSARSRLAAHLFFAPAPNLVTIPTGMAGLLVSATWPPRLLSRPSSFRPLTLHSSLKSSAKSPSAP